MAQIMLDLPQDVRERVEARSLAANQKPEIFLLRVIEEYLEAQEDAEDVAWIEAHQDEPTVSLDQALQELGLD